MGAIVAPTEDHVSALLARYQKTQPFGLTFAIGYASPQLSPSANVFVLGNPSNQFGQPISPGPDTPFQMASVSKTFTATLYALLLRSADPSLTVGDFIAPKGPLEISSTLAGITLDSLMSYTSGLPQDNDTDVVDTPPYLPQPYSVGGMLSYLNASPPALTDPGGAYTYSNLGFALMAAILSGSNPPGVGGFARGVHDSLVGPLGMTSVYFNRASLETLPLGYAYDYGAKPVFSPAAPGWPLFPSYFGAGGLVASGSDMLKWLTFNMGMTQVEGLSTLLPALQNPITSVQPWAGTQLGLSWFINSGANGAPGTVWKDGDLNTCGSYIAFLQSSDPGAVPSQAGAFAMVNGGGMTGDETNDGVELCAVLVNDVLNIMQGNALPADKSHYPRSRFNRPLAAR